jgi:NADH-quinone oxidoreductase subunit J
MVLQLALLLVLVLASVWAVMTRSLLRSALGLALTSVLLAIVMFRLNAPLAAVFELSVCAGLISVLFVSTVSLTHPLSHKQTIDHMRTRFLRFWFLPVILVATGIVLSFIPVALKLKLPAPELAGDVRQVMWNARSIDMLGQIIILLSGVFGVVVLFREKLKR